MNQKGNNPAGRELNTAVGRVQSTNTAEVTFPNPKRD